MNRRGLLLASETLKIVIAVICIGFLIYFLTSLYFTNVKNKNFEKAEASLNLIESEVERISEGGEFREDGLNVPSPSGWYLWSFIEDKPLSCLNQNCLCICDNVWANFFDRQIKKCDKEGVCLIVENLKGFDKIKIKNDGTFVLIKEVEGLIEVSEIK
ncbi:hypothetical protein KAJ87_02525 [Candidatus Pacearchaeota archaeon]|nr:hypothetical protein [Candidatus Pacearchaeota archaeon]